MTYAMGRQKPEKILARQHVDVKESKEDKEILRDINRQWFRRDEDYNMGYNAGWLRGLGVGLLVGTFATSVLAYAIYQRLPF